MELSPLKFFKKLALISSSSFFWKTLKILFFYKLYFSIQDLISVASLNFSEKIFLSKFYFVFTRFSESVLLSIFVSAWLDLSKLRLLPNAYFCSFNGLERPRYSTASIFSWLSRYDFKSVSASYITNFFFSSCKQSYSVGPISLFNIL